MNTCKYEIVSNGKLGEVKAISLRLNFTGGIYPGFTPSKIWRSQVPGGESVTIGSHALMTAMKLAKSPISSGIAIRKNNFYTEYAKIGADDYAILTCNLKMELQAI